MNDFVPYRERTTSERAAEIRACDAQAAINAATHGSIPMPAWAKVPAPAWVTAELEKAEAAMAPGVEKAHMTTDSAARKQAPITTGFMDYFPDAVADVARLSKAANDKHNPGEPMHWSRGKSDDHADCIGRHMIDRGTIDTDKFLHDTKVAWRAMAQLQLAIEKLRAAGTDY